MYRVVSASVTPLETFWYSDEVSENSQIAELLGIDQRVYSIYETGKREIPLHHFITLAKFYNVSLDYLAGLSKEM